MKNIIFSLLVFLGLTSQVFAQGNIDAGKTKSAMCAACHGATGVNPSPTYPDLAEQHAEYIVKQLKAFKNGTRKDPVMAPMAAGLSDQDMEDLGAYFASQKRGGEKSNDGTAAVAAPVAAAYEPDAAAGKSLYELGDESRSIGACIGCHGKEGNSDVLIYPNLAKQHPEYIAKQLHNFKTKARTNNYAMAQFASGMTDNDIADMAAYLKDPKAVANAKPKKVVVSLANKDDVAAGKIKAATCIACHGTDGNSLVSMYPKLAGQNENYLAKQLHEFKSGTRKNPVMAPMASALSEQDIKELSAYYSAQVSTPGSDTANELGSKLYFGGDAKRNITACVACHGVSGKGMDNAGFPAVANQNSTYLASQLKSFKNKTRNNDRAAMMQKTARKLSEAEITALAEFMSSL